MTSRFQSISHFILTTFTVAIFTAVTFSGCSNDKEKGKPAEILSYAQFSAQLDLSGGFAQSNDCDKLCVDRRKEFRYLVYVGESTYCYWLDKQQKYQFSFLDHAARIEKKILKSTSEFQYFMLLMEWAALFRDGHVNAILDKNSQKVDFFSPPLEIQLLNPGRADETLIVAKTLPEVKNLKIGTEVTTINGQNWKDILARTLNISFGSTEALRRRVAARLIFRKLLQENGPESLLIQGNYHGQVLSENVGRNILLNLDPALTPAPADAEPTGKDFLTVSIIPGNIGYLRIDAFQGSQMSYLLEQALDRLSSTKGLMIDLRKNGGGDLSGNIILEKLKPKMLVRYFRKSIRSDFLLSLRPDMISEFQFSQGPFSDFAAVPLLESKEPLAQPVSLLIANPCFSACDTFATAFREHALGKIYGEPTGGGTGTPIVLELPISHHSFRYSVWRGYGPVTQQLIEGRATEPDLLISQTANEKIENQDLQLKAAVEAFSIFIDPSPQTPGLELPPPLLTTPKPKIKRSTDLDFEEETREASETF